MTGNSTAGGGVSAAAAVAAAEKAAKAAEEKITAFANNVGIEAAQIWADYKYYIIGKFFPTLCLKSKHT